MKYGNQIQQILNKTEWNKNECKIVNAEIMCLSFCSLLLEKFALNGLNDKRKKQSKKKVLKNF